MKNFRKISLMLILTVVSILLLAVSSKATTKVKVTGDVLNIRKGPSTSTKVVAMLSKGVECELLEEEGDWYKVKYKTYTGYVSKEYAEIIGETNNTEEPKNTETNTDNKNDTDNTSKNEENNTTSDTNIDEDAKVVYKKLKQDSELKLLPLVYSSNIESLKKNAEMILLSEVNGWSYVQTDSNCGWIRNEYLEDSSTTSFNNENTNSTDKNEYTEKTGYINESSVNMRKGAGTSYSIVKVLSLNTQLTITGEDGKWYQVKVGNTTGYVSKDYVSDTKTTTTRGNNTSRTETVATATETTNSSSNEEKVSDTKSTDKITENKTNTTQETTSKNETTIKSTDIVAYAKKYLGYKYVYGGDGSNGTFDCSGFTMYVYKHFGIKLPHAASKQYKCGKGIQITKYSDLQVGDIVFLTDYETGVGIGHCGIYLGNDNFIHASTTCYAVEISSFKTIYKGRFYSGLRLI